MTCANTQLVKTMQIVGEGKERGTVFVGAP